MALRFVNPSTRVGTEVNFCRKASDRLCAGSVEMSSTLSRTWARRTARLQAVVVLPTPPLPPTKTHLRDCWSSTFWRVGSSSPGAVSADAIFVGPAALTVRLREGAAVC